MSRTGFPTERAVDLARALGLFLGDLIDWASQPGEAVTGQLTIIKPEPRKPAEAVEPPKQAPFETRTMRSLEEFDPTTARELGARLRAARVSKDFSIGYVAGVANVSKPTYAKFESGKPHDSMAGLKKACSFLGVKMPQATGGG